MWGQATGDANMEARGNLMLAIQARALSSYFLMQSDNAVQPPQFVGNKADGILFENKVDHTTYFGTNIEYIEGCVLPFFSVVGVMATADHGRIHMLPLGSHSGLTRPAEFVREEWATYFDGGRADAVAGGWRGILYANLALEDPVTAWGFFSQPNFDMSLLDAGASLSWYLTMAATLGGASGAAASGFNASYAAT
jgi:endo-1,3(4)-beta-glucanase